MQGLLIEYILLILVVMALAMIAVKLRIAYPIVLVLGGLLLSFTSVFPHVDINHDLVFFFFLPPLLYEASWQVSWKEFWKWRRVITSFAFPIVIITALVIAWVSHWLIPGFTLALGFLLGGIISPPDAVSATTIMRQVQVPRSMMSILEGESLLNDASSLIVFRFALAAVVTGSFHLGEASLTFLMVVVMGILIGVALGFVFYAIHRWLPTTPTIEIGLTLVTPYCMYYAAEHFHYSGVLAVVSGGLLLSSKRQTILTYRSRLEGGNVWANLVFVLNGLVFMLIGLELRVVTQEMSGVSFASALGYALIITAVLILARFLCTFGSLAFTKFASHFIKVADANPGWKAPLVTGWAGMRGVVSLAAALSIPEMIAGDRPFPHRNLILFITFVVILVTLVFQGLTLPWLVRKVNMRDKYTVIPEAQQELIIQKKIAKVSLQFLEQRFGRQHFPNEHIRHLHSRLQLDVQTIDWKNNTVRGSDGNSLKVFQDTYLEMLETQRTLLKNMNQREEFTEELIRKYSALIDMEEYKVHERLLVRDEEEDASGL